MGRFSLSSPDCERGLADELGVQRLEWYFHEDSLDTVSRLTKREIADMLLDFRRVFPHCSDELARVSERLNARLAELSGKRIVVTMAYESRSSGFTHDTVAVRVVYLRNGDDSLLVNDL